MSHHIGRRLFKRRKKLCVPYTKCMFLWYYLAVIVVAYCIPQQSHSHHQTKNCSGASVCVQRGKLFTFAYKFLCWRHNFFRSRLFSCLFSLRFCHSINVPSHSFGRFYAVFMCSHMFSYELTVFFSETHIQTYEQNKVFTEKKKFPALVYVNYDCIKVPFFHCKMQNKYCVCRFGYYSLLYLTIFINWYTTLIQCCNCVRCFVYTCVCVRFRLPKYSRIFYAAHVNTHMHSNQCVVQYSCHITSFWKVVVHIHFSFILKISVFCSIFVHILLKRLLQLFVCKIFKFLVSSFVLF